MGILFCFYRCQPKRKGRLQGGIISKPIIKPSPSHTRILVLLLAEFHTLHVFFIYSVELIGAHAAPRVFRRVRKL